MKFSTQHISYLERNDLDALSGKVEEATESIRVPTSRNASFIKILGISNFWQSQESKPTLLRSLMQDTYTGLYGEKVPLIFLLINEPPRLNLFIGTYQSEQLSMITASLQSAYPGIDLLTQLSRDDLLLLDDLSQRFSFAATVTGTPTTRFDKETDNTEKIERLIRGLNSAAASQAMWAYVVIAEPALEDEVNALYNCTLNELRMVENEEESGAARNSVAEQYKEFLKTFRRKLEIGKTQGAWYTAIYFLSQDSRTFHHGKAIIKAVFSGEDSRPDPIRVLEYQFSKTASQSILKSVPAPSGPSQQIKYPFKYISLLNAKELASLAHLPAEEVPGYSVKDYAHFDVDVQNDGHSGTSISIGQITNFGQAVGIEYYVYQELLKQHTLIVGITGSGKTNTTLSMLEQAWLADIPFLVIEPAKTEYRKLLFSKKVRDHLKIFTLGDETTSPLRLNPFEILPGISVQTHIDYLKSVFNATFTMYAPMNHVLEECLHKIYRDKGWNLVENINERGNHPNSYPTLTDLYRVIDDVVNVLEHEEKIKMNIKGALKTRINSLRIGGKGLMLDTRKSIPIQSLLETPTVLELEQIGDDDEKAFLIGLLLTFMCEYYTSQGIKEGKPLTHITVIEEAHRLFKNVPPNADTEAANIKGKAVETFCNILSEIRAYGEGFIIAEQIPTKLASDIIKNTNLKVMHRLVSADDRRIMGATMNLDREQERQITSLCVGEAAVYSEGDDSSLIIQVPYSKIANQNLSKVEENQLIRHSMRTFTEGMVEVFAPLSGSLTTEDTLKNLKKDAEQIVENYEFQEILARYVISTVTQATSLVSEFPQLVQVVNKFRKNSREDFIKVELALIAGVNNYFEKLGQNCGWQYEEVQQLTNNFLSLMSSIALGRYMQNSTQPNFSEEEANRIRSFQDRYLSLCSLQYYPYAGCEKVCADKLCLYRHNVQPLLNDARLDSNFINALAEFSGDEMWNQVKEVAMIAERRTIFSGADPENSRKAALCFVVRKSESTPYLDAYLREKIIDNMVNFL